QQLQEFVRERTACVAGIKTMRRFGWKLGDRITLMGAMWPCNLDLTIRGVYSGSVDETNLFFHHEYFDEALGDKGSTGLFWVGYEALMILALLLAESCGLAILGGVLGCAAAWGLLHAVDIYRLSRGLFVNFEVTPQIVAEALAVAALLGVVSCLGPALTSIRRS